MSLFIVNNFLNLKKNTLHGYNNRFLYYKREEAFSYYWSFSFFRLGFSFDFVINIVNDQLNAYKNVFIALSKRVF